MFTKRNRIWFLLCLSFLLNPFVYSQTFQSEKLASIAKKIALSPLKGDSASIYMDAGEYRKKSLVAGIDVNGIIFHLGYKLFPKEIKKGHPQVVFDFVERYFLELDALVPANEMAQHLADDKVVLLKGRYSDLSKITIETPCAISYVDDKYYEVSWTKDNNPILCIAFPAQYELLLGMQKNEIEKKLKSQIMRTRKWRYTSNANDSLEKMGGNVYRTKPCANYYVESLNTARYFALSDEGDKYPIFSSADTWHSAANLFQGAIPDISGYRLFIQQNVYGFETMTYSIALTDWLGYCQQNETVVYFAIEEEREDGIKALLIAQSKKLGFNHMMSIILPSDFVDNPKTVLKATLNAYIPTQNIKNLYQQQSARRKRKRI